MSNMCPVKVAEPEMCIAVHCRIGYIKLEQYITIYQVYNRTKQICTVIFYDKLY